MFRLFNFAPGSGTGSEEEEDTSSESEGEGEGGESATNSEDGSEQTAGKQALGGWGGRGWAQYESHALPNASV